MKENKEIYLTPEGAERLRYELEDLINNKRAEIAQRLHHAVEMGDLSENADYIKAKEDQAFLEGRIQELEFVLREAIIVEKDEKNDVVRIGNTVIISQNGGSPETFQLVGVKEANPREGKISHESPIGKALLGKSKGETAIVQTPGGQIKLTILDIK
jgi:transcription elongation factor GreA